MLQKIRRMLKNQEGFTLVELMIVVVILGIISGIGIQQYGQVQTRAKVSAHNANVRIIEGAIQMYIAVEDPGDTEDEQTISTLSSYLQEPYPTPEFGGDAFTFTIAGSKVTVIPGRVDDKGVVIGDGSGGDSGDNSGD